MNTHRHGFSLVELSIVLVILGLLVGGVLAGQSLIRAAELRAVSSEYQRHLTASAAFRDKYLALPGDITNATAFWGAADPTPATCLTTVGTGTQTCNGNGDGRINAPAAASQYGEWYSYWQHLANAGLIEGSYNGRAGTGGTPHSTTSNSPRGRLSNSMWFVAYDASSGSAMFPVALPRNNLRIGAIVNNSWPDGAVFKPEEAWNIDRKIDDGQPGLGRITAPLSTYKANCSSSSATDALYVLDNGTTTCTLYMALNL